MTHRRRVVGFTAGAFFGLALKYSMLFYMGVLDMKAYYLWFGKRALEVGLVRSYQGIYFPLQYQLFELCAWIVQRLGIQFFTVYKLSNLVFDLAAFVVLIALLRRQNSNIFYALLYWLHPWFLAMFSLGYVDFQFTALVLLSVWLLRGDRPGDYLLSGTALGAAFVMKPQVQILVVAIGLFVLFRFLRTRDVRSAVVLFGPVVFFAGYEIYFTFFGHVHPWYVAALVLPRSYLNVSNVMPRLTAQMTNIWYPIAYLLKGPGQHVYNVRDQIQLVSFVSVKHVAAAVVLILVAIHVRRIEAHQGELVSDKLLRVFGFASLVVPFVMTSAHENHLFLGTTFVVLLIARPISIGPKVAGHVLLIVQFLHLFSLYGEHPVWLARLLRPTQSDELAIVYSIVSLLCFCFLLKPLWAHCKPANVPAITAPG